MVDERTQKELTPPKVVILHNEYQQLGGEDRVVENEYQLLKRNGWHVEKLVIKSADFGVLKKIGTAIHLTESKQQIRQIIEKIQKIKPDIVHIHNYFPLITAGIFAELKKNKIKTIHTLHNFRMFCSNGLLLRNGKPCETCLDHSPLNALPDRCYRNSLLGSFAVARSIQNHKKRETWHQTVDHYIALSRFSEERFLKYGIDPQKLTIKPNFIFDSNEINLSPSKNKTALYIGRLSTEKGIETLLKAWNNLSQTEWKLCIMGDGPLKPLVQEYQRQNQSIDYRGHQGSSEIFRALKECSFLVFPSECYENFPITILEAMSAGVPILGSALGGTQEILKPEFSATFAPQNADDLTAKMQAWMKISDKLDTLGKSARGQYLKLYSPDANFQQLKRIYEKTIQA